MADAVGGLNTLDGGVLLSRRRFERRRGGLVQHSIRQTGLSPTERQNEIRLPSQWRLLFGELIIGQQRLQHRVLLAIVRMFWRYGLGWRCGPLLRMAMRVLVLCWRLFGCRLGCAGHRGANDLANLHAKHSRRKQERTARRHPCF